MDAQVLTEEYLSRFPNKLKEILHNPKFRDKLIETAVQDYAPVVPVYRALHREKEIDRDDFVCNVEEYELYGRKPHKRQSLDIYSISVNEDKQQLITSMHIPNKERKILGIAKGEMKKEYGSADFKGNATHHNWYLFEDKVDNVMELFIIDTTEG